MLSSAGFQLFQGSHECRIVRRATRSLCQDESFHPAQDAHTEKEAVAEAAHVADNDAQPLPCAEVKSSTENEGEEATQRQTDDEDEDATQPYLPVIVWLEN